MSLRTKTLIIIGATIIALVLLLNIISRVIVLKSFISLEEEQTRQNVRRVLYTITDDLKKLNRIVGDWAPWDETYTFIQSGNDEYISTNMMDVTFTNLEVNFMFFINLEGKLVFGKAVDLSAGHEVPIPESVLPYITGNAFLLQHPDPKSIHTGIILVPEGPLLLASQPILTSNAEGPIRGTVIMGRFLDAAELRRLQDITHLSISLCRLDDPQMPIDFNEAKTAISPANPIFVKPLSHTAIAGYAVLNDVNNIPSLLLRVDIPRDIYAHGQSSLTYFTISLFLVCVLLCGLMIGLLEKIVLSRLAALSLNVNQIRTSSDLTARVSVAGRDELAKLGAAINGMLTALEQSESDLQRSEALYRRLIDTSPDAIMLTDMTSNLLMVNQRAVELYGYDGAEEMIRHGVYDPNMFGNAQSVDEKAREILASGNIRSLERMMFRKDGSRFIAAISTSVIVDADGKPTSFLDMVRDVTERKLAEDAMRKLNQQLQEANASKDKFFSIIAHDLRSPLIGLLGLAQIMMERIHTYNPQQIHDAVGSLKRSADTVYTLLENLLTWSRVQRGAMEYQPEEISIDEIAEYVVDLFTSNAQQKQIRLSSHIPEHTAGYADYNMINTVLRNLVSNALKFTPAGGAVDISARRDEAAVEISVTDTGTGIPPQGLSLMFRIDVKYTNLGTSGEKGTGLGLILCKDLIEKNSGRIWVESEVGTGTTFRFTLPAMANISDSDNRSILAVSEEKQTPLSNAIPPVLSIHDEPEFAVDMMSFQSAIRALPANVLARLEQATMEADMSTIFTLIDVIRTQNTDFADMLATLANNFEYTRILNFLQGKNR